MRETEHPRVRPDDPDGDIVAIHGTADNTTRVDAARGWLDAGHRRHALERSATGITRLPAHTDENVKGWVR